MQGYIGVSVVGDRIKEEAEFFSIGLVVCQTIVGVERNNRLEKHIYRFNAQSFLTNKQSHDMESKII